MTIPIHVPVMGNVNSVDVQIEWETPRWSP